MTTLCRYEHFKRCLESLERCTGAEHTDVYVALDYPAKESHVEGWKKIDTYLKGKEQKNGFKSLNVRRRNHNCGVGKPGSNGDLLYQEIKKITDRFISFEDDNEFSPCFLEYINKGLAKYKDNDHVISVCGYTPFEYKGKANVYFARQESAWGHGVWIRKKEKLDKLADLNVIHNILKDTKSVLKIYKFRPTLLNRMLNQEILGEVHGDVCNVCYCVLYDSFSIFPAKSLVRNWGNDGSGVHCKISDNFEKIEISNESEFELDEIDLAEQKVVFDSYTRIVSKKWYGSIAILVRYAIWRMTKKDIFALFK